MAVANRRGPVYWIRRYLPQELVGTAAALFGAWAGLALTGSLVLAAIAGTLAEGVGFYGTAVARSFVAEWRASAGRSRRGWWALLRTTIGAVVEYGPAELLDTLLVRPGLLYLVPLLTDQTLIAWVIGKLAADVVFYAVAGLCHVLSRRPAPAPEPDVELSPEVRAARIRALRAFADRVDLDRLVDTHGTPLLVLEPDRIAEQYRRLCRALPFVRFHYAVKALPHPAVLAEIDALSGCFDVASDAELDALERLRVPGERIIHSQPVKTATEITRAYVHGVRLFVIDSADELAKFRDVPADAEVLVRLAFRNPRAKSDLSSRFGVDAAEATELVRLADAQGTRVAGFAFHVGSQTGDVEPWRRAVVDTLALMDRLERRRGRGFTVLDIGGGFPVAHRTEVPSVERIAAVIRPLLQSRADRLRILAEPGRVVAAEAVTAVAAVTGVTRRDEHAWVTIDDGVYGSYSNVLTEHVHPVVVARSELTDDPPLQATTLAGPTCDSADVVARRYPLPAVRDGDLLLSPAMGAYTSVTASRFNGRMPAPIVVVDGAAPARVDATPPASTAHAEPVARSA